MYERVTNDYGAKAGDRLKAWKTLVNNNQEKPEGEKLALVNNFFNQEIRWVDDYLHWKKKDYWATPIETLATGAGDCEDFTIAKYFTLKALNVPVSKMKITYVKALEYNQAHMVMTYYETVRSDPLVLDNIEKRIKRGSQRRDLLPVYSFNGDGLWLAKSTGVTKKVGSSNRIRLWTDLQQRMDKEFKQN